MERVFWSGSDAARISAMAFAKANGMTTLGMTRAGQNIYKLTKDMTFAESELIWIRISKVFANVCQEEVHVFQALEGVKIERVWAETEYKILKNKTNTKIIYHNISTS